ncbi:MAG: hypothetical protein FWG60_00950 [Methanomassiliicoccaceae archaeon]|nr:hypothetical protein [Methanomassiliicoccaceae archaeon]
MEGKKRPILIALIGLITLIMAFLILLAAVIALFSSTMLADAGVDLGDLMNAVGYSGFVVGIIFLIIGVGIWRGWSIMWYIAVILYILALVGSIASIALVFIDGGVDAAVTVPLFVPLIISLLILYYLFRPKVKEFFTIGKSA